MPSMVPALATSLGVFVGIAIGFFVWARPLERARGRLVEVMAEVRAHVLPVLERRATSLEIPKDRRGARDADDAVRAAVTTARAIAASEEKLVLPFSDTVELSRDSLRVPKS
jgi:hypothetical protein